MHVRLSRPPASLQRLAAAAYGIASLLCIAYVAWYASFS
jgi:hypothetical protein